MLSPNAYQISLENLDVLFVQTMDSRTEPIYFSPLYVVKEGEKKKKTDGKGEGSYYVFNHMWGAHLGN